DSSKRIPHIYPYEVSTACLPTLTRPTLFPYTTLFRSVRIDRHCENAKAVFQYLNKHPLVKNVYFPGDENHPQKEIIDKQMADSGAVVSFEIDGNSAMAEALLNHLKLIKIGRAHV